MDNQLNEIELELLNTKLDLAYVKERYSIIEEAEELRTLPILEKDLLKKQKELYQKYLELTNNNKVSIKR